MNIRQMACAGLLLLAWNQAGALQTGSIEGYNFADQNQNGVASTGISNLFGMPTCTNSGCYVVANPTYGKALVTGFSISSNIVTFTANNTFVAGQSVTFTGFTVGTYFNNTSETVLATGLSATSFEVSFTHSNTGETSDNGTAASTNPELANSYVFTPPSSFFSFIGTARSVLADDRGVASARLFRDPAQISSSGNTHNAYTHECLFSTPYEPGAYAYNGGGNCFEMWMAGQNPGYSHGNPSFGSTGGWSSGSAMNINYTNFTPGIHHGITLGQFNQSVGDTAGFYGYIQTNGASLLHPTKDSRHSRLSLARTQVNITAK